MPGTAIRSLSVKSFSDLTLGLRVIRYIDDELMPVKPRTSCAGLSLAFAHKRQESGHAAGRDVERAGKHRVVDHVAAVEHDVARLDAGQPRRGGVLFDELLARHHHQRQIQHAVSVRDADFGNLARRGQRDRERQRGDASQADLPQPADDHRRAPAPIQPAASSTPCAWASAWYDERTSAPTAACSKPSAYASRSNIAKSSGCT